MKKTYQQISDDLTLITVEGDNGERLEFLNGVLQPVSNGKFLAATGPLNGSLMLIIVDYVHWTQNQKAIEEWMKQFDGSIRQEGMILTFDSAEDRTAFMLRWA